MTINGMDSRESEAELAKVQEGEGAVSFVHVRSAGADTMHVEFESFDAKLAQRIQGLASQIEQQTLQLANLRRTAPAETAQRFQDSFTQQSDQYDAQLRRDEEDRLRAAKDTDIDIGEVQRSDEIQSTWQHGAENLMALKSGLGGTVAKMERAQQAVNVIEAQ